MTSIQQWAARGALGVLALSLVGCNTLGGGTRDSGNNQASASPPPTSQPAGPKPGMNARGEVIDPSKVEAGSGRTVKGMNGYEGEITGVPVKNSKFARLQIGMSYRQAMDLAGRPTDEGAYATGKSWIPYYYGGDRHRYEAVYKGQGRLIFAGGGMGDYGAGYLIWIIHSANETGYR